MLVIGWKNKYGKKNTQVSSDISNRAGQEIINADRTRYPWC
jgi:hypothetical protein